MIYVVIGCLAALVVSVIFWLVRDSQVSGVEKVLDERLLRVDDKLKALLQMIEKVSASEGVNFVEISKLRSKLETVDLIQQNQLREGRVLSVKIPDVLKVVHREAKVKGRGRKALLDRSGVSKADH